MTTRSTIVLAIVFMLVLIDAVSSDTTSITSIHSDTMSAETIVIPSKASSRNIENPSLVQQAESRGKTRTNGYTTIDTTTIRGTNSSETPETAPSNVSKTTETPPSVQRLWITAKIDITSTSHNSNTTETPATAPSRKEASRKAKNPSSVEPRSITKSATKESTRTAKSFNGGKGTAKAPKSKCQKAPQRKCQKASKQSKCSCGSSKASKKKGAVHTSKSSKNPIEARSWSQLGDSVIGDVDRDYYGWKAAMSDDGLIFVAGARYFGRSPDGRFARGLVRVHEYDCCKSNWVQKGQDLPGVNANDRFGYSVALSGDGLTVAGGGRIAKTSKGLYYGHARVFEWDCSDSTWKQKGQVIEGEKRLGNTGWTIAISADARTLAVGSYFINGGRVITYEFDECKSIWLQKGQNLDGEEGDGNGGGITLSSDGLILATGAAYHRFTVSSTDERWRRTGLIKVYKFNEISSKWEQIGQNILGEGRKDLMKSVALSSDGYIVATGSPMNRGITDLSDGQVRVFEFNVISHEWEQMGQSLNGTVGEGGKFGGSVRLSQDGLTVAAGAHVAGTVSGEVKVYRWNQETSLWYQLGQTIYGEGYRERLSYSDALGLSSDGETLAIGAPQNKNENGFSGIMRVFKLT